VFAKVLAQVIAQAGSGKEKDLAQSVFAQKARLKTLTVFAKVQAGEFVQEAKKKT
jgi:hypothetical protein